MKKRFLTLSGQDSVWNNYSGANPGYLSRKRKDDTQDTEEKGPEGRLTAPENSKDKIQGTDLGSNLETGSLLFRLHFRNGPETAVYFWPLSFSSLHILFEQESHCNYPILISPLCLGSVGQDTIYLVHQSSDQEKLYSRPILEGPHQGDIHTWTICREQNLGSWIRI